jgi:hypothetical protein
MGEVVSECGRARTEEASNPIKALSQSLAAGLGKRTAMSVLCKMRVLGSLAPP